MVEFIPCKVDAGVEDLRHSVFENQACITAAQCMAATTYSSECPYPTSRASRLHQPAAEGFSVLDGQACRPRMLQSCPSRLVRIMEVGSSFRWRHVCRILSVSVPRPSSRLFHRSGVPQKTQ